MTRLGLNLTLRNNCNLVPSAQGTQWGCPLNLNNHWTRWLTMHSSCHKLWLLILSSNLDPSRLKTFALTKTPRGHCIMKLGFEDHQSINFIWFLIWKGPIRLSLTDMHELHETTHTKLLFLQYFKKHLLKFENGFYHLIEHCTVEKTSNGTPKPTLWIICFSNVFFWKNTGDKLWVISGKKLFWWILIHKNLRWRITWRNKLLGLDFQLCKSGLSYPGFFHYLA